jgi:ferredoxin
MKLNQTQPTLPRIDLDRCNGCGLCEQLCPTEAVEVINGRAAITRPDACTFCEVCESYCPTGAIGRPFTIVFAPTQTVTLTPHR